MRKKEVKKHKGPENYKSDFVRVQNVGNLANEKCPIIPLALPTGDKEKDEENFIMSIRSASENNGFIKGYEYAISLVKEMMETSLNDYEEEIIKNVLYKLIGY